MMDQIIRITIVEIATKEIKMFEYINFMPIGIHGPSQFPTNIILYSEKEIFITDLESSLKVQCLGVKKFFEHEDEEIVQLATSLHMNFSMYAITTKGNLYFIYVDMKDLKITKVSKEFLGTYQTANTEGKEITVNKKPSSLCANEYNILIGYEHV